MALQTRISQKRHLQENRGMSQSLHRQRGIVFRSGLVLLNRFLRKQKPELLKTKQNFSSPLGTKIFQESTLVAIYQFYLIYFVVFFKHTHAKYAMGLCGQMTRHSVFNSAFNSPYQPMLGWSLSASFSVGAEGSLHSLATLTANFLLQLELQVKLNTRYFPLSRP